MTMERGRYVLCRLKSSSRLRTRRNKTSSNNRQNDLGNKYSPTVIAAAITSQTSKTKLPTHRCRLQNMWIKKRFSNLSRAN